MNSNGDRNDLKRTFEMLRDGANMREVAEENPAVFLKYHKGMEKVITLYAGKRDANVAPNIEIYWGQSGTGKSRKAILDNPDAYIFTKPNGNGQVWFDGYEGQNTIIFDEFYGWISYDMLLRILDRYALNVQIKGGFVSMKATHFIFTSNRAWEEWYPNITDQSALKRRIDEWGTITKFVKDEEINFM